MREKIKRYLSNVWLYAFLWLLNGLLGTIQRWNSPRFDQWMQHNGLELQKQGYHQNVMDLIGASPIFVIIAESILLLFCMGVFALVHILLRIKMPQVFKYVILLLPACIVVFSSYKAVEVFIENVKWGFYILAIQDVVWAVYLFFMVTRYCKLITKR